MRTGKLVLEVECEIVGLTHEELESAFNAAGRSIVSGTPIDLNITGALIDQVVACEGDYGFDGKVRVHMIGGKVERSPVVRPLLSLMGGAE